MKKALLFISLAIAITAINMTNAQTYDPYAVQVINNLIANNGLQATPDAPETWGSFAKWNDEIPKKIIELNFSASGLKLSGTASFAKLTSLKILDCSFSTPLKEIDVTGCSQLQTLLCIGIYYVTKITLTGCNQLKTLDCRYNALSKIDLTSCPQLQVLECFSNKLTELDITKCTQLQKLSCGENLIRKLDLTNNKNLLKLEIWNNSFIELDLSGLNKLTEFLDMDQRPPPIILYKNKDDEYTCPIMLNNPTFTNSAISYSEGILKSTDKTVGTTNFTVQTNKKGFILEGWLTFIYSNGDINEYDSLAVKRINDLIANNGLNAKPNAPETWWEFATWNNEMPKKIIELILYGRLKGIPSFEGLKTLKVLDCDYNNLTEFSVKTCTGLKTLFCRYNKLTEINLAGLNNLENFFGIGQEISLSLIKNDFGEYTHTISLNNPTFGNSAISYSNGVLKSTDNMVKITDFTVQTDKPGFVLSGAMNLNYSDVGISEPESEEVKIYPNPTTGELTISCSELRIIEIEIYDIHGRKEKAERIKEKAGGEIAMDISHLQAGIYFVKVFTEQGEITKKIVKQ